MVVNHESVVHRHHKRVAEFLAVAVLCALVQLSPCSAEEKDWMIGTELDLLPYISGGYYLSLVGGVDKLRGRVVRTELTVPDFATDDAFTDNDLGVWALILDVYFKKNFKGWWIGPGLERWDGDVYEINATPEASVKLGIRF